VSAATRASTTTTTQLTHTVARGEGLLAIASRYRVSVDALAAANDISNPNQVFVGQVLVIPPSTLAAPPSPPPTTTSPSTTSSARR
jgi:lysozyme